MSKKTNLDSLFEAALEIEAGDERAVFIDESCGTDHEMNFVFFRSQAESASSVYTDKEQHTLASLGLIRRWNVETGEMTRSRSEASVSSTQSSSGGHERPRGVIKMMSPDVVSRP